MIIKLSPQLRMDTLKVIKTGDNLNINGEDFDFSVIPEGATLPADAVDCEWLIENISRENGELTFTFILPLTPDASENQRFPQDIIDPPDGEIIFPQKQENKDTSSEV